MGVIPIETTRLRLRRWRTRDIPWLREMLSETRGPVRSWLAAYWQVRVDRRAWAMEDRQTGEGVGWVSIDEGCLGYAVRAGRRRQGFTTEAVRALLRRYPELRAEVWVDNKASRRVLEKCGFVLVRVGDRAGRPCAYYASEALARHNGGVADFQAAFTGGENLAGVEAALRIE